MLLMVIVGHLNDGCGSRGEMVVMVNCYLNSSLDCCHHCWKMTRKMMRRNMKMMVLGNSYLRMRMKRMMEIVIFLFPDYDYCERVERTLTVDGVIQEGNGEVLNYLQL